MALLDGAIRGSNPRCHIFNHGVTQTIRKLNLLQIQQLPPNRQIITLTRGDTASITVNLTDSTGAEYEMQSGDTLVLSLKKHVADTDVAFQKTSTTNTFNIIPEDTKELEFIDYVYDIALITVSGEVYTVVPKDTFTIGEEVG